MRCCNNGVENFDSKFAAENSWGREMWWRKSEPFEPLLQNSAHEIYFIRWDPKRCTFILWESLKGSTFLMFIDNNINPKVNQGTQRPCCSKIHFKFRISSSPYPTTKTIDSLRQIRYEEIGDVHCQPRIEMGSYRSNSCKYLSVDRNVSMFFEYTISSLSSDVTRIGYFKDDVGLTLCSRKAEFVCPNLYQNWRSPMIASKISKCVPLQSPRNTCAVSTKSPNDCLN